MTKIFTFILAALSLCAAFGTTAFAGDLEDLAGKWSVNKTNENGQAYTQVIEFKKDKFTFKIAGGGKVFLYAQGDVKVDKLGPFNSIKFFNIKGGQSADDLQTVDDDRTIIYRLQDNKFTVANNFDKEREQGPATEVYTKTAKPD
jgi:hypothetical protein